jgi:hypothetical protein
VRDTRSTGSGRGRGAGAGKCWFSISHGFSARTVQVGARAAFVSLEIANCSRAPPESAFRITLLKHFPCHTNAGYERIDFQFIFIFQIPDLPWLFLGT